MSFERLSIILFLNFDLFEDIFTRNFLLDLFFPNSANNSLKWIHIYSNDSLSFFAQLNFILEWKYSSDAYII